MARIELAPEVLDDFERFIAHMERFGVQNIPERIGEILDSIQVLVHSPLIGWPARDDRRELVIGQDSRGYVALYRYVASIDTVFVLTVRAQRESGFKH
ncbi:type II toxin-antitoxin system RelE/ParE family toxin [Acidovorax cavernicola]|uniref:Type II toxin-antitoxin system RelE/ParE family toxin n=1 Tax=Acidovorax cavernicola TaxID=1675792 RepID=A0A9X8GS64_9BURK|nr:type II toxin-antitoxin system RelE/ParE family toxin [Acidovorax cavernicola]RIX72873.1 type II toxin-antitoxin system RelE/ParE family toxin [Acidovorax cavernicola]